MTEFNRQNLDQQLLNLETNLASGGGGQNDPTSVLLLEILEQLKEINRKLPPAPPAR